MDLRDIINIYITFNIILMTQKKNHLNKVYIYIYIYICIKCVYLGIILGWVNSKKKIVRWI